MNAEIEMMKWIVECLCRRIKNGINYVNKNIIGHYQYFLKQYYTIKRYWEETRE